MMRARSSCGALRREMALRRLVARQRVRIKQLLATIDALPGIYEEEFLRAFDVGMSKLAQIEASSAGKPVGLLRCKHDAS